MKIFFFNFSVVFQTRTINHLHFGLYRSLRLSDDNGNYASEIEKSPSEQCSSQYSNYHARTNRTPTPATLLPEDLNDILTDVDLQEEANRRLQEEKDAVRISLQLSIISV